MSSDRTRVLVIGYGNPGRLDDGLGPAFADALEKAGIPGVTVDSDYQLTVEDASEAARHDVVVFADAHVSCSEPFEFSRTFPGEEASFSTHSVEPEAVLALAEKLFASSPKAYTLAIRGYEFNEFGEGLSERASHNLSQALQFIIPLLESGRFDDFDSRIGKLQVEKTARINNGDE